MSLICTRTFSKNVDIAQRSSQWFHKFSAEEHTRWGEPWLDVEPKNYPPIAAQPVKKYPPGLIEEYQELALKKFMSNLSEEEETCLQQLIQQISDIDRKDPAMAAMQQHFDSLYADLQEIRRQAEQLLDAKRCE